VSLWNKVRADYHDYWVKDQFPFDLLPEVKKLGIGGLAMEGLWLRRRKSGRC